MAKRNSNKERAAACERARESATLEPRERRDVIALAAATSATCDACLFGRCVIISVTRGGKTVGAEDRCECHLARPTRDGFPVVRRDDWCSMHVNAKSHERTFGGIVSQAFQ